MCTGSDLISRVARARLPYAENLVSGDLLGAYEDVCARAVPACGVRKCGCTVGVWATTWVRGGGACKGNPTLVGFPLQRRGHVRTVCGRTHGGLVDAVSFRSAGSDMRGHLVWCGVQWLFQGCCSGRRPRHGTAVAWRAGTLRKGS